MTIDDFDINEISDKLAIREETGELHTLEAAHNDALGHDDGHDDASGGCYHNDLTNPPWHDDAVGGCFHNDGHYDIGLHDDGHDDACPGYRQCP